MSISSTPSFTATQGETLNVTAAAELLTTATDTVAGQTLTAVVTTPASAGCTAAQEVTAAGGCVTVIRPSSQSPATRCRR